MTRRAWTATVTVIALFVVAGGMLVLHHQLAYHRATLYFERTDGLYVGDDVRVLGLTVGTIDAISPQPGSVRVDISYTAAQPLPADARAAIIAPTLVTARFVQIAPVYTGGPKLTDGAVIPLERTATPIEWDQLKEQLNRLAVALGPQGANRDGALANAVDTAARNLAGQGTNLGQTITNLAGAVDALSAGRNDLTGTIGNLQQFVSALAANDAEVRAFSAELADASKFLAEDRTRLADTLRSLEQALGKVQEYVRQNRDAFTGDLHALTEVTGILAEEQNTLAALLQNVAPTLSNFYNIYDPVSGSMTGAPVLAYLQDPAAYACSLLAANGAPPGQCQQAMAPLLNRAATASPPISLNPMVRPGSGPPLQDQMSRELANLLIPGGDR